MIYRIKWFCPVLRKCSTSDLWWRRSLLCQSGALS